MKRAIIPIFTLILLFSSCGRKSPITGQRMAFGTVVNIKIYDAGSYEKPSGLIESCLNDLQSLDSLWAYQGENSDIYKLEQNAGVTSALIDARTFKVLAQGLEMENLTGGCFNLKIGAVTRLWGFHNSNPHLPDSADISAVLDSEQGSMFFAGNSCLLGKAGMALDIGGIGKGFAVDLAVEKLMQEGIKAGIVEAGGDLKVLGLPEKGKPWKIGIRHPRNPEAFYAILSLENGAVATSGDYQQYFEEAGKRYHHIIDPKTGYPPDKCVSSTVWAKDCIEADALATALFVMGPDEAMKWLEEHPDYLGLIIYFNEKGELADVHSPGLKLEKQ